MNFILGYLAVLVIQGQNKRFLVTVNQLASQPANLGELNQLKGNSSQPTMKSI